MENTIIYGSLTLPEISGAAMIGNNLLVVSDDFMTDSDDSIHMIDVVKNALPLLRQGGTIDTDSIYLDILRSLTGNTAENKMIKDLEDVAVAPNGTIYVISSHSRNKKNESQEARQQLLRLCITDEGHIETAALLRQKILDALPEVLKVSTKSRPGAKASDGQYMPGFNIEGLAWKSPGDLLIGLRSPTLENKALVLCIKNVDALFDDASQSVHLTIVAHLDLQGLGIRSMTYDDNRHGYWLIAGLATDPDDTELYRPDNNWSVWFWKPSSIAGEQLHQKYQRKDFSDHISNPEVVSVLVGDYLLLISDDNKKAGSSYALINLQ